jgi:hypothetical protein
VGFLVTEQHFQYLSQQLRWRSPLREPVKPFDKA